MPLQYLKNDAGETTAVLIPIEEWKAITQKHPDFTFPEKYVEEKPKKASDFKGILSPELTEALQKHVQQSREQWG